MTSSTRVFLPFFLAPLLAFACSACGVKGPPLPPAHDTPQQSDRWAPKPSPSPVR